MPKILVFLGQKYGKSSGLRRLLILDIYNKNVRIPGKISGVPTFKEYPFQFELCGRNPRLLF